MNHFAYIIMGVSGSGKSTIGKLLSEELKIDFFDGDDFHPEENIKKMAQGISLNDSDRYPWLIEINNKCKQAIKERRSVIFACSALKEFYRKILSTGIEKEVVWIYLKGNKEIIGERLQKREGHFMPVSLLESQFDTLEEPIKAIEINTALDQKIIIKELMNQLTKSSFGIVGLGVMGKSLARNFANKGVNLSLYNRNVKGIEEEIAKKAISEFPELKNAKGFEDLQLFVASLEKPRKIFIMIKAGDETDTFIEAIVPFLEADDILIDGGNSHYLDTKRRMESLFEKQIYFIGTGVSGGEKGALNGPSIMPSGSKKAYKDIEPYLQLIAAKDTHGNSCCAYIGAEGSGHYVKMVHNGIEYAEMQLIAETYAYLRYVLEKSPLEISEIFQEWNSGVLSSYLLEITSKLLLKKEGTNYLIDLILDKADNKGTGNWTTISASELGMPNTIITAALFARYLSTIKETILGLHEQKNTIEPRNTIDLAAIKEAYQLSRIVNHQQGFMLLRKASETFKWHLDASEIARIWTNGCIIRSAFMEELVVLFKENDDLFSNPTLLNQIPLLKPSLKKLCTTALEYELPIPCYLAVLDYLNTLNGNYATANIIQAQRDYFGAHQYQKKGDVSGRFYHSSWEEGS
jgi:6-phosphogluconate dehydrogenase